MSDILNHFHEEKKKISSYLDHWCLKIKVAQGLSQAASIAGKLVRSDSRQSDLI